MPRPLKVKPNKLSKFVKKYLEVEAAQSRNAPASLKEKLNSFQPMKKAKHDVAHKVNGKTTLIHPTGCERANTISFTTKGQSRTLKVFPFDWARKVEWHTKERFSKNYEQRFNAMKKLAEAGAPVVKPVKLAKTQSGKIAWIEEYGGIPFQYLAAQMPKPIARWHLRKVKKASRKVQRTAKKQGLKVWDDSWWNALYDPRTGEIKFTDLELGKSIHSKRDKKYFFKEFLNPNLKSKALLF